MALQGTLETFALTDVLRLLASTKKTGCYRLEGDRGSGALWLREGQIVAGEFSGSPATEVKEVTFELLRFGDGDFVFDDATESESPGDPVEVEAALESAEAMLAEWESVAAVVPSLDNTVTLRAELPGDEVTIRADQWIFVVAVGGGTTVGRLGAILGLGELPISKAVKDLVDLGVVEIGEPSPEASSAAPAFESSSFDPSSFEPSSFESSPFESSLTTGPIPEPEPATAPVIEFAPLGESAAAEEGFGTFDPDALVVEDRSLVADEEIAGSAAPEEAAPAESGAGASDAADAAEIARQLANLSPKAAKAVAAAAKATTPEEREAALAEVDDEQDPINRDLLLKFLGSVNG